MTIRDLSRLRVIADGFLSPSQRSRLLGGIRVGLSLASVAYIAHRLSHLGWESVAHALPTGWSFYGAAGLGYLITPLFEWTIYRRLMALRPSDVGLFFRKRALNEAVLDYSGELDLYLHLRRHAGAGAMIKDTNLLSGMVSNVLTLVLLLGLLSSGDLHLLKASGMDMAGLALVAGAVPAAALILLAVFHRRLLSRGTAGRLFILRQHTLRLIFTFVLQIAQWSAAIPHVGSGTWALFMTIWMLATRIPFVPNRDLLLATIGLSLAELVAAPPATVTAMFVIGGVMPLAANLIVLIAGLACDALRRGDAAHDDAAGFLPNGKERCSPCAN